MASATANAAVLLEEEFVSYYFGGAFICFLIFVPKGPSRCFLVEYVGWETTFFSGSELLSRAFAIGSRELFFPIFLKTSFWG